VQRHAPNIRVVVLVWEDAEVRANQAMVEVAAQPPGVATAPIVGDRRVGVSLTMFRRP
jgi:hypothetical protein